MYIFIPNSFLCIYSCLISSGDEKPIGPDGLFVSQRTGSHSAGIHVPFTNCFVCRWFCVVHDPKPPLHSHEWLSFGKFQDTERFPIHCVFRHDYPLAVEPGSTPRHLVQKKTWRDSLPIDMLLSAVSVLVVAQSSSEIPEGLMNNPVFLCSEILPEIGTPVLKNVGVWNLWWIVFHHKYQTPVWYE